MSGVTCRQIRPESGEGSDKQAMLVLTLDGEEEADEKFVMADFVVGADGLKSVVRAHVGGDISCFLASLSFMTSR